nr:hypothetical protein [uncultured Roseateles sp.]
MTTTLRAWLDQAWDQHPDQPQAVAERLAEGIALLDDGTAPAEELARLGEHLLLGHLDQAPAMSHFIAAMQPAALDDAAVAGVLRRAELGLLLAGHGGRAAELPPEEQLRALGQAMLALTRRPDLAGAEALLDQAQALARHADDSKSWRALSIVTNNLAGDMRYYREQRPADEGDAQADALMLQAAQLARVNWAVAGGWKEVERADYQLALCHAAAGQGTQALQHAQACLARCEANGADAYELFFAHEALAIAHATLLREQRGRMAAKLEMLDDASAKAYAQATLAKLDARFT